MTPIAGSLSSLPAVYLPPAVRGNRFATALLPANSLLGHHQVVVTWDGIMDVVLMVA